MSEINFLKPEIKKRLGRPSIYTKELATQICDLISIGYSVNYISKRSDMPNSDTIYSWIAIDKKCNPNDKTESAFSERYVQARDKQQQIIMEKMLEVAQNAGDTNPTINKAKLEIDVLKFAAVRLWPCKYDSEYIRQERAGEIQDQLDTLKEQV